MRYLVRARVKPGREGDLIEAIEQAGRALQTHFPAKSTDRAGQRDIVEE